MRRLAPLTALLVAVAVQPAAAQLPQPLQKDPPGVPAAPPKKDDAPPPGLRKEKPDGPPEFEAKFTDDSSLKVVAIDKEVAIATKYGKLVVPLEDVVRIEVGFRYPEGLESKVEAAVTNLGAPSFRDREEAEKALVNFAEYALPALKRAAKNPDAEVARRADALVKRLLDKLPPEKLELRDYDVVETTELTIRGRLETTGVRVKTKLFGDTTLKVVELRSVRSTAAAGNEFVIDAIKYARQNDPTWFDTGVDVATDRPFELTATGTVDLQPNQPGQYVSTPAGNPQNGTGRPVMTPNGRSFGFTPGQLVGRIGADGNPFMVGASYKATRPPASGRLFLKIAPSAYGIDSSGSYTVKVRVGG
jgi:hypothetical protein